MQSLVQIEEALPLDIEYRRQCGCPENHISCIEAKEWLKAQLGVWQFNYEGRDIRDKDAHPATFPIALPARFIELLTHRGELVLDPFNGSGSTLIAARDLQRNGIGFDLSPAYVALSGERLNQLNLFSTTRQIAICDDARNIPNYLRPETVSLIVTSPPYANLLNRKRKNKSRRGDMRRNHQYDRIEQYSQDPRDLGTLAVEEYEVAMAEVFQGLLPLLRRRAHCVINIPDMWWQNQRITLHISVINSLTRVGYELRNIIIWDRTNIVNKVGIFGWPNNYITMGVTFEYLLDFWRP
ncbi:MAG: site-specific DNA-methyltransferase [Deltaproteobacteria bacterium]|nr:site-specific DNA-methyltransferase [Chloroflexota bacterium]MBM3302214.1 site-specific DNA-methyltransferase [Deltaproteobacteria bacterium]